MSSPAFAKPSGNRYVSFGARAILHSRVRGRGGGARPLYICIDQSLDADCLRKGALTLGEEVLVSQGHW